MSDAVVPADTTDTAKVVPAPLWLSATLAVVFGLFYAYDAWEGVGNLVGVNMTAQQLDTQVSAFGWTVLIVGVLMPVLVFALAFWMGRKRTALVQALMLFVGLCLVAALSLDILVVFSFGRLIV
ncbi:bacitracin resistance protein [Leifsonia sp. A12D58]|uniref:bacitracin resistance protein n=1 Tax=Leifsonia sp. A12D58 TaxID=3397674 RepID=UPI0039E0FA22